VLLLHLAQDMYLNNKEEVFFTLDLLSRLASFNTVSWLVSLAIYFHFDSLKEYINCF
jgi:hypothetical protein